MKNLKLIKHECNKPISKIQMLEYDFRPYDSNQPRTTGFFEKLKLNYITYEKFKENEGCYRDNTVIFVKGYKQLENKLGKFMLMLTDINQKGIRRCKKIAMMNIEEIIDLLENYKYENTYHELIFIQTKDYKEL